MAPLLKDRWNQHSCPCKSKTMVCTRCTWAAKWQQNVFLSYMLTHHFCPFSFLLRILSRSVVWLSSFQCLCSEVCCYGEAASANRSRQAAPPKLGASCWEDSWTLPRVGGGTLYENWYQTITGKVHLICCKLPRLPAAVSEKKNFCAGTIKSYNGFNGLQERGKIHGATCRRQYSRESLQLLQDSW